MLTASLVLMATLFAGVAAATSTQDISPYPLGERSILSDRAVEQRLKPVGSVCVQGEDCGTAVAASGGASGEPRDGETVYNGHCAACHGTGAAGAPVFGDAASWKPHVAKGMDTLVKHAIEGFNAMPPKGMCSDCSDEEIKNTVQYMVDNSK
ncbi:c-type cytochrome [Alloalcanivorax mobilis]|uniref:c-type cytochrome n=1 Tax=Alloalcanivorax mobilis TaxID=2019569 RepID=UPI000B5B232B|nr:cytochrome c5 family protein [Alloalcanivorax mobilis]ASK36568.1 cytochrome C [Alcanivorax sp. N3-2A]|tara:strand:- start:7571 stop:8026 length:456 start_codon:yes stop_codon:yes gene_type:complete